jgi:hypothetical protein
VCSEIAQSVVVCGKPCLTVKLAERGTIEVSGYRLLSPVGDPNTVHQVINSTNQNAALWNQLVASTSSLLVCIQMLSCWIYSTSALYPLLSITLFYCSISAHRALVGGCWARFFTTMWCHGEPRQHWPFKSNDARTMDIDSVCVCVTLLFHPCTGREIGSTENGMGTRTRPSCSLFRSHSGFIARRF